LPYLDTADKAAIANALRDLKETQDKAREQEIKTATKMFKFPSSD